MKIFYYLLVPVFFMTLMAYSQQEVKNPSKPASPNSGRAYTLTEVLRIADDGERFYFKNPRNLQVDSEGNVFLLARDQFLKFNSKGEFVANFLKTGQGPGELVNVTDYILLKNGDIMLQDHAPNKVVTLNSNGALKSEERIYLTKYLFLLHNNGKHLYFREKEAGKTKGKWVLADLHNHIHYYSRKEKKLQKLFSYPTQNFVLSTSEQLGYVNLTSLRIRSFKSDVFVLAHTRDYQVKMIDVGTGKELLTFSRDYERVPLTKDREKYVAKGTITLGGIRYQSPVPEHLNDIQTLLVAKDKILVFTSTVDKKKGILVDVFDGKGAYTDCFYLHWTDYDGHNWVFQRYITVDEKYFYSIVKDENEDWVILKFSFEEVLKTL